MRMMAGDINVYYQHVSLTPGTVRAAAYGTVRNSGTLVPDVGDYIRDFHGYMGAPTTVRVTAVESIGDGCLAYQVTVVDA